MDDWRPLAEVDVVVNALHASANQLAVGTPGAFEPQAPAAYEAQAAAGGYDAPAAEAPAYEAPAAYAAPAPEPKRAAVAKREARARDLFATNAGEELHTSAPATPHAMAPAGDTALTGQRNENSVLFSLAVLTKDTEARPSTVPPTANKEDSGLIDLKALAQKAESMRPMAMGDGDVFNAPLGLTPPLGAPVGALGASPSDAQPKSKLPLMIGGGAGVLVLLVLGIVIGVKIGGSGPAPLPTPVAVTATAPPVEPSATAAPAPTDSAETAPSSSVAAATPKKPGPGAWHPGGATTPKATGGSSGGGSSGGTAPTAAPTATKKAPAADKCGCNGDLMCLMKCSTH
jgi:hypothetical protein